MLIRLFFILILCYSCSTKDTNDKKSVKINLQTESVYHYDEELFNLTISYKISNDHFVFIKEENSFKAKISTTIQIYDINNDSIITQDSWVDEILELEFDETRSPSKYVAFDKTLNLPEGEYNLKVNVQDLDNGKVFRSQNAINLSSSDGFGELSMYAIDKDELGNILLSELDGKLESNDNSVRLSFQFFSDANTIDEILIRLKDSNSDYEEKSFNLELDDDGFYSTDIMIPDNFYNNVEITLTVLKYSITKDLLIKDPNNQFWTNDINEIISVMRYILPVSKIKELKGMELEEKREFVSKYWQDKDPDPSTKENELLNEFVNRVEFSNFEFSDINKGYRTDRGRIYIVYGPPESVETYSNQYEGIYQVWQYSSGFNFVFLDRNGFGNFLLVKQSL